MPYIAKVPPIVDHHMAAEVGKNSNKDLGKKTKKLNKTIYFL
jgi:hypothetical protein